MDSCLQATLSREILLAYEHLRDAIKLGMEVLMSSQIDDEPCLIYHLEKHVNKPIKRFHFSPARVSQKALIHQWLEQKHIREWLHGVGLQNTLNGLEKFFRGASNTTYWMGYDKDIPFAFLITSPEREDTITLDVFICDLAYLGKGLAVTMIREFLLSHFSNVKRVRIDPEATNTRAIHVYEKVGFKIREEFIASWHPVPHYQMELYMRVLFAMDNQ